MKTKLEELKDLKRRGFRWLRRGKRGLMDIRVVIAEAEHPAVRLSPAWLRLGHRAPDWRTLPEVAL